MKIDSIVLSNFGSYEGTTRFETKSIENRNIILIGGKNGAGKTTLFTAMRVCLYGYSSMGYKSQNSYYLRSIMKLINNAAKMQRPVESSVTMQISLNSGHDIDKYELKRTWVLDDNLKETFSVKKNGQHLDEIGIADFEKYLISLIPPELFNLYFFDGEKIADFFLEEGSNTRIRDAFLTLCGYDTFEIMRRNFKRIATGKKSQSQALEQYININEEMKVAKASLLNTENDLTDCLDQIADCNASIEALEKDYKNKGGITEKEWNEKLQVIKEEEQKRERYNTILKKWANDIVPFLMIKEQVHAVKAQIQKENINAKFKNFCEILGMPEIEEIIGDNTEALQKVVLSKIGESAESILDFSFEQSTKVLSQVNEVLEFESDKVIKCKRAIKKSIETAEKMREELKNSSVSSVQEYMQKRSELLERKSALLTEQVALEQKLVLCKESLTKKEQEYSRVQERLEEEIKKESINNISAKALIMLDKLQERLYKQQIQKVEKLFKSEIKILMRKTKFIEDIHIDDSFNVHIYRSDAVNKQTIIKQLCECSEDQIMTILGERAFMQLRELTGTEKICDMVYKLRRLEQEKIELSMEIDKTSLSNGEKQIFIMALYHSLIQLCNHEIPFVIDTPFARIDTEHRRNISEHFFRKLNGQVFILSTNEEINTDHVKILSDKIATTYMLENTDNKKTIVASDKYFEV